ncbi:MAG: hypothetical protein MN733_26930, partial [Nitrososphaera sp.]|nr:hypothetical protein [Nitrososphaera sp.]
MELHKVDNHHTLSTFAEFAKTEQRFAAIDIETTIGNPWKAGEVILVCTAVTFDGWRVFVFEGLEWLEKAKPYIERLDWCMHNGLFDKLILETMGFNLKLKHDTMAMQYLLDPDEPKSLEELTIKYLG